MNMKRVKFSRRHFDIFLSNHVVMLIDFQITGVTIEIPGSALVKRHCDHWLRRIKLNQFAVQINPGPASYPVFIDIEKVRVCDYSRPMHFEFDKVFPVNVLDPIISVQHWKPNFPVGVSFYIGSGQSFSDFLRHVVPPSRSIRSGNQLPSRDENQRRCDKC